MLNSTLLTDPEDETAFEINHSSPAATALVTNKSARRFGFSRFVVIAIAVLAATALIGCGKKAPGVAVVNGSGEDTYRIFDAAGSKQLAAKLTNQETELPPGNYIIELNGARQPLMVRSGQKTSVAAGLAVVNGSGEDVYRIFDSSGNKQLVTKLTNQEIELLPGQYTVEVNAARQPLSVQSGQKASVAAGLAVVNGGGQDVYRVFDSSGNKQLGTKLTNQEIELLPGQYAIEINGARQPLSVQGGQKASVAAGAAVVSGGGQDVFRVFDASGNKQLGTKPTNQEIELLPGQYTIELNGARQSVTVPSGQRAIVGAGAAVVNGNGQDVYRVFDAGGNKQLGSKPTNQKIELLPGQYTIEFNGSRKVVQVQSGKTATIQ